jgi:hypothetical protein
MLTNGMLPPLTLTGTLKVSCYILAFTSTPKVSDYTDNVAPVSDNAGRGV